MKKLSIANTLLMICLLSPALAQKCKIGTDPFSNERTVTFDFMYKTIYYEFKGNAVRMEMKFTYNGALKVIVPAGAEVQYKFENGDMLKLTTIADAAPKTTASASQYSASFYSDYTYAFNLTREEVEKLAASKVILIRYPDTQGGTLDFKPKGFDKKLIDVLYKGANCIKENYEPAEKK